MTGHGIGENLESAIGHSESAALSDGSSALPRDLVASLSWTAPSPNQLELVTFSVTRYSASPPRRR